jgi:hypothetical protein
MKQHAQPSSNESLQEKIRKQQWCLTFYNYKIEITFSCENDKFFKGDSSGWCGRRKRISGENLLKLPFWSGYGDCPSTGVMETA